jgi:hypothetical protein
VLHRLLTRTANLWPQDCRSLLEISVKLLEIVEWEQRLADLEQQIRQWWPEVLGTGWLSR